MSGNICNITSANAIVVLVVEDLYPAGIQLQDFATDQAVSVNEIQFAETRMGVDGNMAAGYTPAIIPVTITLEASSSSAAAMGHIYQASVRQMGYYPCTLVATVPAVGRIYTWTPGVMKAGTPFTSMRKVLEPTVWKFDFTRMTFTGI